MDKSSLPEPLDTERTKSTLWVRREDMFPSKENLYLTVIAGADIDFGREFRLVQDEMVIGRSEDSTIQLSDARVSRHHSKLSVMPSPTEPGAFVIEIIDLGSTNGTFVNNTEISRALLRPGDKIRMGETILKIQARDEGEVLYHQRLYDMATKDHLTRLFNKNYFEETLKRQLSIAQRHGRMLSLLMIDLDRFKSVNDEYGHLAGDLVLQKFANILRDTFRQQDIVARWGGEEFAVILPETDVNGAVKIAERMRRATEESDFVVNDVSLRITVSIGVSSFPVDTGTGVEEAPTSETILHWAKALVENADRALLWVKNNGRNATSRYNQLARNAG